MTRLSAPERSGLSEEDQAVWDRIAAVRGGVRGPYGVLMHVPQLADRVRAVEDYFRFDAELPDVDRELVILTAAREMEAPYAWARHERLAQQVGTRREAIEAVRANASVDALTARERLLVDLSRTLLRNGRLSDELYAQGVRELGQRQLIELVALAGHYSLIGLTLGAFEIPQPDDLPASYTF